MTIAEKITRAKADYDAVFEAGKKAEYDAFWDEFQENGVRRRYGYAFSRWLDTIFYPKYDIVCTESANWLFAASKITDLKGRLQECGVVLDTSGATSIAEAFAYSTLTRIPTVSTLSTTGLTYAFASSFALVEIEKIILKDNGSQSFNSTFVRCDSLEKIIFEGVIGQNGFNVQWSTKLSKASITSIINALSSTTGGLTVTLSKTAVNTAFETSAGAGDGSTSAEWQSLIATKSNWTISLI